MVIILAIVSGPEMIGSLRGITAWDEETRDRSRYPQSQEPAVLARGRKGLAKPG